MRFASSPSRWGARRGGSSSVSSCARGWTRSPSRSSHPITPRRSRTSLEVGHPVANKDFLLGAFSSLGENRREALRIAAGLRGEDAFNAGVAEEQALETVLPWLSRERCEELVAECLELYVWDRLGSDN
jgi:hypothetical protein